MFKDFPKVLFFVMIILWFFDSIPNLIKKGDKNSCVVMEQKK